MPENDRTNRAASAEGREEPGQVEVEVEAKVEVEVEAAALRGEVDRLRALVAAATEQKRRLDLVLGGLADGLLARDPSGAIAFANAAAARMLLADSPEALVGASVEQALARFELFDEAGRALSHDRLPGARVFAGRAPEPLTVRFRARDADKCEDRWLALSAASVGARGGQGGTALAVVFLRDVTDAKRTQDALRLSEARLAATLRSIDDAVISTDGAGRVSYMNPLAEALTGRAFPASQGLPLSDVFPALDPETRRPAPGPFEQVLHRRGVVAEPSGTSVIPRAGGDVAVAHSAAPIWDERGELAGVVLAFRDVTRELHARQREEFLADATALLSQSLEYRATLAGLARLAVPRWADLCAIELLDAQGRLRPLEVAHADPAVAERARAAAERLAPDPEAPHGAPRVVRTGRAELVQSVTDKLLSSVARDEEHFAQMKSAGVGSYVCVPLAARGRVLGAMTFAVARPRRGYDEADLAFAEELGRRAGLAVDNARLYHEAQEASRLRDEFLATVSHELRTPLTAILGWVHILKSREPEPGSLERGLGVIERNARAQAQLIDDLLDTSRIISGKLRLEARPVDAASAVAAAVEMIRPAAEAKGVRVESELPAHAGSVYADPDRLQQVAWNLLANAIKFTPRGGNVRVSLARVGTPSGPGVELRVSDTGEGIRAEFLPYIFERFRQGDSSPTRKQGGLGLGLAIVRHIVELHGGSVRAESEGPGRGATFTVVLPGAGGPSTGAGPGADAGAGAGAERAGAGAARGRLHGLRVLVVDDEPDARELLEVILGDAGARVVSAASAEEGLARVQSERPDVLVSDIGMPRADGYELAQWLRALPAEQGGATPAVALTAYARVEDARRALEAGYQRHVTKPIDPARLVEVVAELGGR